MGVCRPATSTGSGAAWVQAALKDLGEIWTNGVTSTSAKIRLCLFSRLRANPGSDRLEDIEVSPDLSDAPRKDGL